MNRSGVLFESNMTMGDGSSIADSDNLFFLRRLEARPDRSLQNQTRFEHSGSFRFCCFLFCACVKMNFDPVVCVVSLFADGERVKAMVAEVKGERERAIVVRSWTTASATPSCQSLIRFLLLGVWTGTVDAHTTSKARFDQHVQRGNPGVATRLVEHAYNGGWT